VRAEAMGDRPVTQCVIGPVRECCVANGWGVVVVGNHVVLSGGDANCASEAARLAASSHGIIIRPIPLPVP
jgi:hypothetical protein